MFIVLTIDAYRDRPDPVTLTLSVSAAVLAVMVAPASMLPVAMTAFAISLAVRHLRSSHA